MSYFREFRVHWPNLLGAGLGLGFGAAINHHLTSLFAPALIAEFGWTRSQFALTGLVGLASMLFTPIAGRLTDYLGPRKAAMIGFSVLPAGYFCLSLMTGPIWQLFAIMLVNGTLGILTATMVFTRVVVERFDIARGIALAVMLSSPPLIAAVAAPLIGSIIESEGWRTAYRTMAGLSAMGGIAAVLLIGRARGGKVPERKAAKLDWAKLREFARNPLFILLTAGMFLVNLPQVLVASQFNLMLMENGASMASATLLLSLYQICVVVGRFVSGWSLDRIAPHMVAIFMLGLPVAGYLALASSFDALWVLAGVAVLVGLAQGAETDVSAFLTSRRFELEHFAFVFSMQMMFMGLASALGSALLSFTLRGNGTYDVFLVLAALSTLAGALCFFMTGRYHERRAATGEP
ncbi:MAG: MFS transporter [Novosphingobium sp.]|nr:MFS transporter [Novosphingobium sp.]